MIGNVRSAGGGTHGAFTWGIPAGVTGPPTSLFDERSEPDRAKSEGEPLACSLTPKIDHNEAIRHRATLDLIAVGTPITERPPQSGRIEARTGLRMMPTFPRSPLSFRTAGFRQYGWKAGLLGGGFPEARGFNLLPGA